MLLPAIPLDELRERVREAEGLLRIARQHAREARGDASRADYAGRRIAAVLSEVDALFPGLGDPQPEDPNIERMRAQLMASAAQGADADAEGDAIDDEGDREAGEEPDDVEAGAGARADADDDEEADDEPEEWDIDYAQLARAIENEALMSAIPEPDRAAFAALARHLIETQERANMLRRVRDALDQVSEVVRENMDEAHRKLALALTFEHLANKQRV